MIFIEIWQFKIQFRKETVSLKPVRIVIRRAHAKKTQQKIVTTATWKRKAQHKGMFYCKITFTI